MKQTIEEIRKALVSLGAYDEECEQALNEIDEASDVIDEHPIRAVIHEKLGFTVAELKEAAQEAKSEKNSPSSGLAALQEHLAEAVAEHPTLSLAVGRLANALSVAGL